MNFDELIKNVLKWADDKSILKSENAPKQMLKVMEEVGDGIGDAFVTLIILAKQCGFEPNECLQLAWDEIKDRKGVTKNGVFVKA